MFLMIQNCSTWLVLKEFLDHPLKKFYIREISRKIKLAPTSVKIHVEKLRESNLIKENTEDIFKYYTANFDSENFRFYKKINTLIKIQESGILEYIDNQLSPDTIILFGSAAKGEDNYESDMDLYVQTERKEIKLEKYEKKLKRKIQLFIYKDVKEAPKELRNNIINGIKLGGYIRIWN